MKIFYTLCMNLLLANSCFIVLSGCFNSTSFYFPRYCFITCYLILCLEKHELCYRNKVIMLFGSLWSCWENTFFPSSYFSWSKHILLTYQIRCSYSWSTSRSHLKDPHTLKYLFPYKSLWQHFSCFINTEHTRPRHVLGAFLSMYLNLQLPPHRYRHSRSLSHPWSKY